MTEFKQLLIKAGIHENFLKWMEDRTSEQAWKECRRGDWLFWELERLGHPKETLIELNTQFVELVFPIYEAHYPDDPRIRDCIEGYKRFSRGEITEEELEKLRKATYIATVEAFATACNCETDNDAIFAAGYVACATLGILGNNSLNAIVIAKCISRNVAGNIKHNTVNASSEKILKQCADIVRKRFPNYPGWFVKK